MSVATTLRLLGDALSLQASGDIAAVVAGGAAIAGGAVIAMAVVAIAVSVMIVGGALVSADMRDHRLGQVARLVACDATTTRIYIRDPPGQPIDILEQHHSFLSEDQPDCLSDTSRKGASQRHQLL